MAATPPPAVPEWAVVQPAPAVPDVLLEHIQELAFLWIQRKGLMFSADAPLPSLLRHQARIDAHWDALVIAGQSAVEIALEHFDDFDPWESAAALRVWLELGNPGPGDVIERFDAAAPKTHRSWREALRWLSSARLAALFPPSATVEASPALQAVLVYAWGWQGLPAAEAIARAAFAPETALRLAAARALGGVAGTQPNAASLLSALLTDAEVPVRRAALWSLALQRPAVAAHQARTRVSSGAADVFDVRVLGLVGAAPDLAALRPLLDSGLAGPAARAIGDLGAPDGVGALIDSLARADEALAPHLRSAIADVLGPAPHGFPAGGEDGPDASALRDWWKDSRSAWGGSERWLRGQPFPWRGAPQEEPMISLWRSLVLWPRPERDWVRREVPSFFFEDEPPGHMEPGQ
jgi:hypothetical protein